MQMSGMRFNGNLEGAMRFGFAGSLRDLTKAAADAEARKLSEAGLSLSGGQGAAGPRDPIRSTSGSRANTRASVTAAPTQISTATSALVSIGADYVLNRSLLVGTMVQFDSMQQRSNTQMTDVRGHGWMAGPYATLRLSENVFLQARGAWGRSSNFVSPFLTYTDTFDSERWLVSVDPERALAKRGVVVPAVGVGRLHGGLRPRATPTRSGSDPLGQVEPRPSQGGTGDRLSLRPRPYRDRAACRGAGDL